MKSNTTNQEQHYALDDKNNLINIKDANDLKDKKYYCPHCHNEMIKRQGEIRQWHFAHKTDKCSYDKYLHSIAEIMIMDWFNKSKNIYVILDHFRKCKTFDKCIFYNSMYCKRRDRKQHDLKKYYSNFIKEYCYKGFIADLYCENNKYPNSPIFIEIFVTHKCREEKINSGIRIIELKIESEEDIDNIINSNKLEEGKKIKFYNFKRKEILVDNLNQDFQKYILFPSMKSYVDTKYYNCKNYAKKRKGIYEISLPFDDCIPDFNLYKCGGLRMIGTVKAYLEGKIQKDCYICKWQNEEICGDKFCMLYKKCGNPKYCIDNDASKCSMFKEDTNKIKNTKDSFDKYLENGHIDIWEADK